MIIKINNNDNKQTHFHITHPDHSILAFHVYTRKSLRTCPIAHARCRPAGAPTHFHFHHSHRPRPQPTLISSSPLY